MKKKDRQAKIMEVIRTERITSQHQLLERLQLLGVEANQSSISRDLTELMIEKADGVYQLPIRNRASSVALIEVLSIEPVGENLVVMKTPVGQAQLAGVHIDRMKLPDLVGTVAGDDTIFIAVRDRAGQQRVVRQVLALFQSE
ncbi:MAG: arginine repressor [Myxococcales bacterium]|nr:arginine repressor [Myxococcales bacterium]MCB9643454.1 arginine repressor [Myxococcales bacterium]